MSARLAFAATVALVSSPAAAQDAAELANRFERALVAGDYRVLPITEDFTYTENGAQLKPWDGMWRTLTAVAGAVDFPQLDYRLELTSGDSVVRLVEFEENTVQGVMAYRLVARGGQIARVDILPIREEFGGDRGGTLTLLQPVLPATMDGERVKATSPELLAPGRVSRRHMQGVVASYITANGGSVTMAFDDSETAHTYRFAAAEDCARIDNGMPVTNVADADVLDPAQPSFRPFALGCEEQLASGFYTNFDAHLGQTYFDEERGIALAFVRLDQPGTVLSFEAPGIGTVAYPGPRGPVAGADTGEQFDGRILTNMITPMSVNGVFVFKFDGDGAVSRIEAFYRGAPYGWDALPD